MKQIKALEFCVMNLLLGKRVKLKNGKLVQIINTDQKLLEGVYWAGDKSNGECDVKFGLEDIVGFYE